MKIEVGREGGQVGGTEVGQEEGREEEGDRILSCSSPPPPPPSPPQVSSPHPPHPPVRLLALWLHRVCSVLIVLISCSCLSLTATSPVSTVLS